jgi:hypothetical protein
MIKAKIVKETIGYFLIIDHDDETENAAWAITKEEILPIRNAIDEFIVDNKDMK